MKQEDAWKYTLRALWSQAKPYKGRLFLAFLTTLVPTVLQLMAPVAAKRIVDAITSAPQPSWEAVQGPFFFFAAVLAGTWFSWRIASICDAMVRARMEAGARTRIFERLSYQSAGFFSDSQSGKLLTHINDFSRMMGDGMELFLYQILATLLFIVSFSVVLAGYSLWHTFWFLLGTGVLFYVQYRVSKWMKLLRERVTELQAQAGGRLADAVGNLMTAKVFARERTETANVGASESAAAREDELVGISESKLWGLQNGVIIFLEIGIMGAVLRGWALGQYSVGDIVLIQGYLGLLFGNLVSQSRVFRKIPSMFAAAGPAAKWLLEEPQVVDVPGALRLRVPEGAIMFDRVRFGYDTKRTILKDFVLTIAPKEKVAFVGLSGAGKSTIIKLLYRFYDPQSGAITIDGTNIATVTQESLRRSMALVPQDPTLFHRSILENIKYARPNATQKDVMQAAKRAHCDGFIKQLKNGYDSLVGDRGVKLSGGERQRVALARAILADTPILVLDEATSSLDSSSEALIKEALHEAMRDKTVLVIAHRLSTIMEMDRIIVMEDGKVAAEGTHAELLKQDGLYKRLWNLQAGGYLPEVEEK